jgi:hypothetical protein
MYTNKAYIEAYLQRELTTSEEVILNSIISQATLMINSYTNRSWIDIGSGIGDISESTRYYDGNRKKELFVDDFRDLSKVKFELMEFTEDDEWVLYPLNSTIKNSIRLIDYRFPYDIVEVTAKFTSGELPADVQMVATELSANLLADRTSTASFKKESIEGYSYEKGTSEETINTTKNILNKISHHIKRTL